MFTEFTVGIMNVMMLCICRYCGCLVLWHLSGSLHIQQPVNRSQSLDKTGRTVDRITCHNLSSHCCTILSSRCLFINLFYYILYFILYLPS